MFQVDQQRRAKFEEGLAEGMSPYDAAIAAGYCARYARQLASPDVLTEEGLIEFAWKEMHDRKCPEPVKQKYWERLGQHLGLWGPKAPKTRPAKRPEPVIDER